MIELLIVQVRALLQGPIYMIRFGTSGSLSADVPIGCFAISNKANGIRIDYENLEFPYEFTKESIDMDEEIYKLLFKEFTTLLPEYRSVIGPVWSADTFYGSQGREDNNFINNNKKVISKVLEFDPNSLNFEMEAYVLAFLCNKFPEAQIKSGAICITLAQRTSGDFLSNEIKYDMENKAALVLFKILSEL